MTIEEQRHKVILVSGIGHETASVRSAHEAAAAELDSLGIATIRINPDYPSGELNEIVAEIRGRRSEAVKEGFRVSTVGTSGGGTLLTAERIMTGDPTERGVTICSRRDLACDSPEIPGQKYPTYEMLVRKSPLLVSAARYVQAHVGEFPFSSANTLCFTGGKTDEMVPPESSVLPGALVFQPVGVRGHSNVVGAVLRSPSHIERIARFVKAG